MPNLKLLTETVPSATPRTTHVTASAALVRALFRKRNLLAKVSGPAPCCLWPTYIILIDVRRNLFPIAPSYLPIAIYRTRALLAKMALGSRRGAFARARHFRNYRAAHCYELTSREKKHLALEKMNRNELTQAVANPQLL